MASDVTRSEVPTSPELGREFRPFYNGIAHNTLYFHGTRTRENLDGILSNGLEPPSHSVSDDTLARRISFSDSERYSGNRGFIIGLRPLEDEIAGRASPQFASEVAISHGLDRLPVERVEFYIPVETGFAREIFKRVRGIAMQYYDSGHNTQSLLQNLEAMVGDVEQKLSAIAVFTNTPAHDHVHQIAQEIVWNEFCGFTTAQYRDLEFYSTRFTELGEVDNFSSIEQIAGEFKKRFTYADFDAAKYRNSLAFLREIGDIPNLGFENLVYPISPEMEKLESQLQSLKAKPKPPDKDTSTPTRIHQLRERLKQYIQGKK